jgi:hypothetical protein
MAGDDVLDDRTTCYWCGKEYPSSEWHDTLACADRLRDRIEEVISRVLMLEDRIREICEELNKRST